MELEFERTMNHFYEMVGEGTICQEETMESIVPDACPDILRMISVCGTTMLTGKEAKEGVALVHGKVQASILYQPEEGGGLRRLEVSLPFHTQLEVPGLTEQGVIETGIHLRGAEARALNPRKVLLRADVVVEIRAYQRVEQACCSQITGGEDQGLQQMTIQRESYQLAVIQEKPLSLSDQIRINGGQGESIALLSCRGLALCSESKLIGNKLILKGTLELQLLFQDITGTLFSHHESLGLSQIMEVIGVGEGGDCRIHLTITQVDCQPAPGDGRSLDLTVDLLAQAQIWVQRSQTLLQDFYSTSLETQVRRESITLCQLLDQSNRVQNVRELLETGALPRSVVDSWIYLDEMAQKREGDQLVLTSEARIHLLYLDETETLQTIQRSIPVAIRLDAPQRVRCYGQLFSPGELFATPVAGGIEVRFTLELPCLLLSERPEWVVCGGELGEARTYQDGKQPSMVLRLAAPGESLWDIAKAYGTTMEQIIQANELEEESLPSGTMLLIPSVR